LYTDCSMLDGCGNADDEDDDVDDNDVVDD
jgi:hypothetical protein